MNIKKYYDEVINLLKRIFIKKDIKLLEEPKDTENKAVNFSSKENSVSDFELQLKRSANPNICDGNGFGIVKITKLEDIY